MASVFQCLNFVVYAEEETGNRNKSAKYYSFQVPIHHVKKSRIFFSSPGLYVVPLLEEWQADRDVSLDREGHRGVAGARQGDLARN